MTGPAGRPARGRRDNGLDARDFVPLIDVDPRVGEHLLDVLALAGIAAYLQPSSDLNPVIRSTTLPSRPTDRLWADRRYANEARNLLAQHESEAAARLESDGDAAEEAGEEDLDVDAVWEQIVAGFHDDPAAAGTQSWPAAEETDEDRSPGTAQDSTPATAVRSDDLRPAGPPAPGPRDHSVVEPSDDDDLIDPTDDEGYEPPPPPPLPRPSSHVVLGVVSVLVGFLLFFRPDLLGVGEDVTMVLGIIGVLGGAGLLIYQLRDGLSADDDPDDGAVV